MQPEKFKEQAREELALFGPPHPGEIFRDDVMRRLGLSRKALAKDLGVSYGSLSRFINGQKRVSPGFACELARVSGTSLLYWLVLQAHHDAWRMEARSMAHRGRKASRKKERASSRRGAISQEPRAQA